MKLSKYFAPTLREAPQDADAVSVKLMIRAGLIRKVASGIYEWLPLGFKTLKKVEKIVREEMDAAGGQEVWLPVIHPKELWEETGRWNLYGKELLRINDRKDAEFCFSPTAEEVITDMVRRDINSWRQLPVILYQFGEKFRDEIRPRFGVMRAREFYMKDAYSFDADEEGANKSYQTMFNAYENMCRRFGFKFKSVEADTGAIGGNFSHEFMVLADTGENAIASCVCGYAANVEKAEFQEEKTLTPDTSTFKPLTDLATPGVYTIEDVSKFLKAKPNKFIKALVYIADEHPVLVLMRGDHELNEIKLKKVLGAENLDKAPEYVYTALSGCDVGFIGPVNIREKMQPAEGVKPLKTIIADNAVKNMVNAIAGANKSGFHSVNVNVNRDFKPDMYADLRDAKEGDLCIKCGEPLEFTRGIEIGHCFKLGTKYSAAMKAEFLDEKQQKKPVIMGCYGVGISRIVAASIEQNHDENGIIWPAPIAPFALSLISLDTDNEKVMQVSQKIYDDATKMGIDVLWDEREERPGIKFKDADLMGMPYRIVISSRTLENNEAEFKKRTETGFGIKVKTDDINLKLEEIAAAINYKA